MENSIHAERHPAWKRMCNGIDDIDFVYHGLLRCMSSAHSGRHYLQLAEGVYDDELFHSTYFNALKASRRKDMVTALEKQSYKLHSQALTALGINYLEQFPELDDYRVEAADGHFIEHACHTPKNKDDKVFAAGFIHALNLKTGLLRPLAVVTNGTDRHHEIPVLRRYIEERNGGKDDREKHLYVYDKAVIDFKWWDKQKRDQNFMITVLKENCAAEFVESIPFDANSDINTGIIRYSVYTRKKVMFNLVEYRDPETGDCHQFISTLPKAINPGTIALLYFKRWTIEKAFNNSKSDLTERKAWSPEYAALNNQMRFTAMAYNIMRVFEEMSKIQNPALIHPSDTKYNKALVKRQRIAKEKGGFVNPLFFQKRIARICSFTIRTLQIALMMRRSITAVIFDFQSHLKPRVT